MPAPPPRCPSCGSSAAPWTWSLLCFVSHFLLLLRDLWDRPKGAATSPPGDSRVTRRM